MSDHWLQDRWADFSYGVDKVATNVALRLRCRLARPFRDLTADPQRFAQDQLLPRAERSYGIMFTPRSGSSYLAEVLAQTGQLGQPGEVFNPDFVPKIATAYNASNVAQYCAMLWIKRQKYGLIGFEITPDQMLACFSSERHFMTLCVPGHWLWLIREDIVAQAVSSSRMIQTRIAHDRSAGLAELASADKNFVYDAPTIRRRIATLRWREIQAERFFARWNIRPLRMSYEQIMRLGPVAVAQLVARHIGIHLLNDAEFNTVHRKLGTEKSISFAERFRNEHSRLISRVERERAQIVTGLAALSESV